MMKKERFKKLFKVKSESGKEYDFNGNVHIGEYGTIFVNEMRFSFTVYGGFRSGRATDLGYVQVHLRDINGKDGFFYIHRLIAEAWLSDKRKPHHNDVCHKDDNPSNNTLDNIAWCTTKENINQIDLKGRRVHRRKTNYPIDLIFEIRNKKDKGFTLNEIFNQYPHVKPSSIRRFTSNKAMIQRGIIPA